jgi:hypothetical protein
MNMKKLLIVGFILLFVSISVHPSNALYENYTKDVDNKSGTSENKTNDEFKEIITFIDGYVDGFKIKGIGIPFNIEMWGVDQTIDIYGYRKPLFPIGESHFFISSDHVIAPYFIGICWQVTVDTYSIKGIAFGNIEWS